MVHRLRNGDPVMVLVVEPGVGAPGRRALPRTLGAVELTAPRLDATASGSGWLDGCFRSWPRGPNVAQTSGNQATERKRVSELDSG
jgi:hypothetical protein